ncbi:nucleotide sugar dehydrogenase [Gordonia sp. CPCC 205515]
MDTLRDTPTRRRVGVVGMGYVGLPTALSLAESGAEVTGLDVDETRLTAIKKLAVDLLPRDLERLETTLHNNSLHLTTEPSHLSVADGIVICVPTPVDSHLTPDLAALTAACATVVQNARRGQTIVLTSTTYPGCTADILVKPLQAKGFEIGRDIYVAFSPERIDPGVAAHSPELTPRVLGGVTPECCRRAAALVEHTAASLHLVSSPEAAEMTKLVENTFRAVNIALANEFADAAREMRVDVMEVISAAATKPYGFMPFYPSAGVGGHCIPCDPHYLLWQLRSQRTTSPVVEAAMTAIAARPRDVITRARTMLGDGGRSLRGARVLIVGVAYKAGVADVRESPALAIIDMLTHEGAAVSYSDPLVETIRTEQGSLYHVARPQDSAWDLVVLHTLHPDQDLTWLTEQPVLDTTFRASTLADRVTL